MKTIPHIDKLNINFFFRTQLAEGYSLTAIYLHESVQGKQWVKIRLDHPDPSKRKVIRYAHYNGIQWVLSKPDTKEDRIYPYPHGTLPPDLNVPIVLVEGERKADSLIALGIIAVSIASAGEVEKHQLDGLKDRPLIVWSDNDDAGAKWQEDLAKELTFESIDITQLNLPPAGDAIDWLQTHSEATKEDVLSLPRQIVNKVINDDAEWETPSNITDPILPVEKCPVPVLPTILQEYIKSEATRLQVPEDFIFVGFLIACAGVLGTAVWIKPKARDSWMVPANLWGGFIADPSSRKTAAMKSAFRFLSVQEHLNGKKYHDEMKIYEKKKKITEAQQNKILRTVKKESTTLSVFEEIQKIDVSEAPIFKRFIANDATMEKLSDILQFNSSVTLVLDEMSGWLHLVCDEKNRDKKAFYLNAWNGDGPYTVDRVIKGTYTIPNLGISLFGSIQPEPLLRVLRKGSQFGNDGFLQRFQALIWPDLGDNHRYVDEQEDLAASNEVKKLFEVFANADFTSLGASLSDKGRGYFSFSETGQLIFRTFYEELGELQKVEKNPLLKEHLAKLGSCYAKICLILHLVKKVVDQDESPKVSAETAKEAAAVIEYLISHARRIYSYLDPHNDYRARLLALKIKEGKLPELFSVRDVSKKGWSGLRANDDIEEAIQKLIEDAWLKLIPSTIKQGRPTKRYLINPMLKGRTHG